MAGMALHEGTSRNSKTVHVLKIKPFYYQWIVAEQSTQSCDVLYVVLCVKVLLCGRRSSSWHFSSHMTVLAKALLS
jgi:hypothetical protein